MIKAGSCTCEVSCCVAMAHAPIGAATLLGFHLLCQASHETLQVGNTLPQALLGFDGLRLRG